MKPCKTWLTLSVLTLLSFSSLAQDADELSRRQRLSGTYHGEVYNGSDMDPVITVFRLESSGRISGEYHVDEENGAYSGTISNVIFDAERTISMEWTDQFGEGFAVLDFNQEFNSFTGAWADKFGEGNLPWTGKKGAPLSPPAP